MREQHAIITNALGQPVTSDAAACGAASHRLRHFWTNMAPHHTLQDAIISLYPTPVANRHPAACAQTLLDPGRFVQICLHNNPPPFAQVNVPGMPLQVLPTLVAHPFSYNFRPFKPGSLYAADHSLTQPNPDERERFLGFHHYSITNDNLPELPNGFHPLGSTTAPSISAQQRHAITG
ncbi:hypothetical protein DUNSADRAFT_1431 [Dunaliella salina]|uniref:Encoded protein n=1 Tax=Dunaliella salina TaxID=3046 RepID=A0ABQ7FXG3_DUNSA|nr:hypothetical protein DUNSADRAFT_1431 [Dunaliella salina]|eukprot:KAF5827056.1 hypothetical protein DUNSADRAFT_1431 [Dunaliella salina]